MLKPSDGLQGVKDFILKVVEDAGPNPCPPIVVGVGIGGTFDKAALLAKKALMRNTNVRNADPFYADLEEEMLQKINALGIGPQGVGGKTTALAVNIEKMPTHIAACRLRSTSTAMSPVTRRWSCKGGGEGYGKENNNSTHPGTGKGFKMWRQRADFGRHLYRPATRRTNACASWSHRARNCHLTRKIRSSIM